jgi:curved DNA-binding protein CbpA
MMTDPYKVLGIAPNSNVYQIKQRYRQLARTMHPDRGGSEVLFNLLQISYAKILEEKKMQQIDKAFNELKIEFDTYVDKQNSQKTRHVDMNNLDTNDERSTARLTFKEHFNKVFEESRQTNPYDVGYGDDMLTSKAHREDLSVNKVIDKFTIDKFNEAFQNTDSKNTKILMKKTEPTPFAMSKNLCFTELGVDKIKDFSGSNRTNKQLHYMDYKVAHSTSKLVDPRLQERRKDYKNIDDLESQRSRVEFTMSKHDQQVYDERMLKKKRKEEQRHNNLIQQDESLNDHFNRVNQLMMTYKT